MNRNLTSFFVAALGMAGANFSPAQAQWVTGFAPSSTIVYPGSGSYALDLPQPGVVWTAQTTYCYHGCYATTVLTSANDGASWQSVEFNGNNSGTSPYGLDVESICAVDALQAWVIMSEYPTRATHLRHTTTGPGGLAVAPAQVPGNVQSVRFFGGATGVAASTPLAGATAWPLYRTTDNGQTWLPAPGLPAAVPGDVPVRMTRLGTHCWVWTQQGRLLHSPDTGLTWMLTSTPQPLGQLTFRDAQHGLATGTGSGQPLYRTADGGATWSPVFPTGIRRLRKMAAVPGSNGTYLSVGDNNSPSAGDTPGTAISFDDGQTWQDQGDTAWLTDVAADANGRAWAGSYGDNRLLRFAGRALSTLPTRTSAVLLYPNPTTGQVVVQPSAYRRLTVFDAAGRQCLVNSLGPTQSTLDLSSLANGVYWVRLEGEATVPTQQRIVIAK